MKDALPARRARIAVLGSTGSIGENTLDVVARHPDRFEVFALSAHSQVDKLAQQIVRFRPRLACVGTPAHADALRAKLPAGVDTEVLHGADGLETLAAAAEVDAVMAAIVGAAGLRPSLAAARAGKRVLLANKESLVVAGALFMQAVQAGGATLLPIDSEHNAIYQCLPAHAPGGHGLSHKGVQSIVLTASGGPFRCTPVEALASVTPEQACAHPNWVMGRKISVDSATMMNKGLEVIEAHWLFGLPAAQIEVTIHPQSVIHSLVRYVDGSVLAQLGNPDMRTPIAYGLAWPDRIDGGVAPLDLAAICNLQFEAADLERFACLRLAYQALEAGQAACVALNAANEVAVQAFLDRRLGFADIAAVVAECLERVAGMPATRCDALDDILALDAQVRQRAEQAVTDSGATV
jgi:1-deoxy-D-xylulose-5-phosphate reductoisomerase